MQKRKRKTGRGLNLKSDVTMMAPVCRRRPQSPPYHELAFNLGRAEIGKLACLLAWIPCGSVCLPVGRRWHGCRRIQSKSRADPIPEEGNAVGFVASRIESLSLLCGRGRDGTVFLYPRDNPRPAVQWVVNFLSSVAHLGLGRCSVGRNPC